MTGQIDRYDYLDLFDDFEAAAKNVDRLQDEALKPLGLTKAQFNILREVAAQGLRGSAKDIAEAIQRDPSTVSDAVGLLEQKKFVTVAQDTKDRRRRTITATPAGLKVLVRARDARKNLADELLSALDDDQMEALSGAIGALAKVA